MVDLPSNENHGLIIDTNCMIYHSLYKGTQFSYQMDETLDRFTYICQKDVCPVGYYPTIRDEAYSNLYKAAQKIGEQNSLNHYKLDKYYKKCLKNLDNLIEKFEEFKEKYTDSELNNIKMKFCSYIQNLDSSGNYDGKGLPEDPDLVILTSSHNENWDISFILSNDGHFIHHQHREHIERNYDVSIIPVGDLEDYTIHSWLDGIR